MRSALPSRRSARQVAGAQRERAPATLRQSSRVGGRRRHAHVTVVWADVEGDEVLPNSAEGRAWPENLRRYPRITVTVVNLENPYEYVVIAGRVDEITAEGADEHIDKLAMKYLGQQEYPYRQPGEVRLLVRVRPDKVSHRAQ